MGINSREISPLILVSFAHGCQCKHAWNSSKHNNFPTKPFNSIQASNDSHNFSVRRVEPIPINHKLQRYQRYLWVIWHRLNSSWIWITLRRKAPPLIKRNILTLTKLHKQYQPGLETKCLPILPPLTKSKALWTIHTSSSLFSRHPIYHARINLNMILCMYLKSPSVQQPMCWESFSDLYNCQH